jgi:hypothetical protein
LSLQDLRNFSEFQAEEFGEGDEFDQAFAEAFDGD